MRENQLVAEAAQIEDLDEFSGMSIRDIAVAITHWPEGSEDQARAIAAIRARAPGIGHNRPPLAEALEEEIAPLLARQADLLAVAREAKILDQQSAEKVTDLIALIARFEKDVEDTRKRRAQPYSDAQRLIKDRFDTVTAPLTVARQGTTGRGGLRGMLTEWEDKREREAAAQREQLRQEAMQREAAAAEARRIADEKAAAGTRTVTDELEVMKAEDEAERLTRRAEAIRPEPTRAQLGQVSRAREIEFKVVKLRDLLGWMLKQDGLAGQLLQAVNTIMGKYTKGLGVDAVERGVSIPGAEVRTVLGAARIRR
jgi:hypothetical protein